MSFFFCSIFVYLTALYFTIPSRNFFLTVIVSSLTVSVRDSIEGFLMLSAEIGFLTSCFLEGMEALFFFISCEYKLEQPKERKMESKTILNKFVCKGINAIFVC